MIQLFDSLPGVAEQRPITIFFYATKGGTIQPIVYLPVVDYEQFLDALAKKVRLHRAMASSFLVGSQKIRVKPVGENAVFGTSLKNINLAPQTPELFCEWQTDDADFEFKITPALLQDCDRQNLAKMIGGYLGDPVQQAVLETDSVVFRLKISAPTGMQIQTEFHPIPPNLDDLVVHLDNEFETGGIGAATEMISNGFVLNFDSEVRQLNSVWSKMESLAADSLKAQRLTLMQQLSSHQRAPLPKVYYGNVGSDSSSCEPAGPGGRRSGGG